MSTCMNGSKRQLSKIEQCQQLYNLIKWVYICIRVLFGKTIGNKINNTYYWQKVETKKEIQKDEGVRKE